MIYEKKPELIKKPELPFDRNDWKYNTVSLNTLTRQLATLDSQVRDWPGYEENYWLELLEKSGGKGFGLELCEHLTFLDQSDRLLVPRWELFDPKQERQYREWSKNTKHGLILRSSAPKEDWLDPRSGVYKTYDFTAVLPELESGIPYVIQERANGFGLVVDIGFSELAAKNVVRISCGRKFPGLILNATKDTESSVGLWEATSGRLIAERHFYQPKKNATLMSPEFNFQKKFEEMATLLPTLIKKIGINFGLQLEMIINPAAPDKWNLVQIRPTPAAIQGEIPKVNIDAEKKLLLAVSPLVSGVFQISAPVKTIRGDDTYQITSSYSESFLLHETDSKKILKGRDHHNPHIAVYDPQVRMDERMGLINMMRSWLNGAEGQILCTPIIPNTTHGTLCYGNQKEQESATFKAMRERCGLISIDTHVIKHINRQITSFGQTTPNCLIVSDGLLGQVYLLF